MSNLFFTHSGSDVDVLTSEFTRYEIVVSHAKRTEY